MNHVLKTIPPLPDRLVLNGEVVIERQGDDLILYMKDHPEDFAEIGWVAGEDFYLTPSWYVDLHEQIEEALAGTA